MVDHVAHEAAAVADLQRPRADGRTAGVGVGARQGQRARRRFHELARAGDRARERAGLYRRGLGRAVAGPGVQRSGALQVAEGDIRAVQVERGAGVHRGGSHVGQEETKEKDVCRLQRAAGHDDRGIRREAAAAAAAHADGAVLSDAAKDGCRPAVQVQVAADAEDLATGGGHCTALTAGEAQAIGQVEARGGGQLAAVERDRTGAERAGRADLQRGACLDRGSAGVRVGTAQRQRAATVGREAAVAEDEAVHSQLRGRRAAAVDRDREVALRQECAGQPPVAAAGGMDAREALERVVLDVRTFQAQRVARALGDHAAVEHGACLERERVVAAAQLDRTGAGRPVAREAAGNDAAVDDGEIAADDARAALRIRTQLRAALRAAFTVAAGTAIDRHVHNRMGSSGGQALAAVAARD
ncbi:hypothetical protein D3C85_810340 [compost metagenome]